MNFFKKCLNKYSKPIKSWIKRHIADEVPEHLNDEFSNKYR